MKIIVYIVIIVLLVGCAFAGVKALKQSSLFQSVANAVDTVKDFVDNAGDGSSGSSSQSGQGGNQGGESGSSQGSVQGGSQTSLPLGIPSNARHIVVGDVFEEGDMIYFDKSSLSSAVLISRLQTLEYETEYFADEPTFLLFGNFNIQAYVWDGDYYISVGNLAVFTSRDIYGDSHWGNDDYIIFDLDGYLINTYSGYLNFPCTVTCIADETLCSLFYIVKHA